MSKDNKNDGGGLYKSVTVSVKTLNFIIIAGTILLALLTVLLAIIGNI